MDSEKLERIKFLVSVFRPDREIAKLEQVSLAAIRLIKKSFLPEFFLIPLGARVEVKERPKWYGEVIGYDGSAVVVQGESGIQKLHRNRVVYLPDPTVISDTCKRIRKFNAYRRNVAAPPESHASLLDLELSNRAEEKCSHFGVA